MLFNICCDLNGEEIPNTGAIYTHRYRTSQVVLVVTNPLANAGDIRDTVSTPGWGRSPGGGNGNPLQYSCLGKPMDRGAWWAVVQRVAKS